MKNFFCNTLIYLLFSLSSYSTPVLSVIGRDSINDGPYIFKRHNSFIVKWVENGELKKKKVTSESFPEVKDKFNLNFDYEDLLSTYQIKPEYVQEFNDIDSVAVISDAHGEFTSYINLLKATGVIDQNLNWSFGTGHLVVVGDEFDRGEMVTEIFWHLFGLEDQAARAGGMVHVVLGNHESLILGKELFYVNDKYMEVDTIVHSAYFDLYSKNSVMGRWIRNQPVVITINNSIYTHAGLSIEMVRRNFTIQEINKTFSEKIIGRESETIELNEKLRFLNGDDGPLWYRGYFNDTSFYEATLDSILDFYGKDNIIVGHTTFKEIKTLFNNKIFGVDAGLMDKLPGEMLIIKNGVFYRALANGKRIRY